MSRLRLACAVLGVAAAGLTACGTSSTPDDDTATPTQRATLDHVHGLGVDPVDGTLFAASHVGVFRIDEDGRATQIADRWQDTMAFTITGPSTFLGSGHPDLREDLPPHLGLIESTDAAETWTPVALQGEADFHALEVAGSNTFGFDALSGRLLFSADRRDWTSIAATPVIDLAWLGEDADSILAATPRGLVEYSVDRSAREILGAPPLVLIDSPASGVLVGVTARGVVYSTRSVDDGPWRRAPADVGAPQAFEATEEAWYVATESGIYWSGDEGARWEHLVDSGGGH